MSLRYKHADVLLSKYEGPCTIYLQDYTNGCIVYGTLKHMTVIQTVNVMLSAADFKGLSDVIKEGHKGNCVEQLSHIRIQNFNTYKDIKLDEVITAIIDRIDFELKRRNNVFKSYLDNERLIQSWPRYTVTPIDYKCKIDCYHYHAKMYVDNVYNNAVETKKLISIYFDITPLSINLFQYRLYRTKTYGQCSYEHQLLALVMFYNLCQSRPGVPLFQWQIDNYDLFMHIADPLIDISMSATSNDCKQEIDQIIQAADNLSCDIFSSHWLAKDQPMFLESDLACGRYHLVINPEFLRILSKSLADTGIIIERLNV